MVLPSDVTTRTSAGDGRSASKATLDVVISQKKNSLTREAETEPCTLLFRYRLHGDRSSESVC
jgi:hypothetical protein